MRATPDPGEGGGGKKKKPEKGGLPERRQRRHDFLQDDSPKREEGGKRGKKLQGRGKKGKKGRTVAPSFLYHHQGKGEKLQKEEEKRGWVRNPSLT